MHRIEEVAVRKPFESGSRCGKRSVDRMIACLCIGDSLRGRCAHNVDRLYMVDEEKEGKQSRT